MRYLADALTSTRFILAIALFVLAFVGGSPESAFIIFVIAELTDVFDGTCSRKWPFPANRTPKYRKYAVKFDILADGLLAAAQILFCTLRVNWLVGLIIIIYYLVVCGTIEFIVYGKLMGHPDNCAKNSLTMRNFPLAKRIILTRRYLYAICLIVTSVCILFATNWTLSVKIAVAVGGCFVLVFIWFFLRQRRHHISRDAVEIEQKLSQRKSSK